MHLKIANHSSSYVVLQWVQCDKCERWQHQVCALYNDQNDLDGKADFICPKCWLKEVENEHYMLGPNTALFSAKDLPKTRLSNHIEKRIFKRLNQERKKRAKATGKRFDEVRHKLIGGLLFMKTVSFCFLVIVFLSKRNPWLFIIILYLKKKQKI